MLNRIAPAILSILLLLVLVGSRGNLEVLAISTLILIAATTWLNFKSLGLSWPHLVLPILFLIGVVSMFSIIAGPAVRNIFIFASVIAFYFLEWYLGKESHLLQNLYLFSVFSIFAGLFALRFYFDINYWWHSIAIFLSAYVLILQGYAGFSLPAKKYFSLLVALICMQAGFGLALWPTPFMVNAIVLFCIFYALWIFSFSAFFGRLSLNKIYLQLALISIVLAATLISSPWQPLVR